jgi:hypothetical protein
MNSTAFAQFKAEQISHGRRFNLFRQRSYVSSCRANLRTEHHPERPTELSKVS